ncbi:MAG: zinc ABC transporter substrate-binding protein [Lagierella massiliensis]|nr:zinc ABC transporter substrate-binding protein [Lagierella massiliensis]
MKKLLSVLLVMLMITSCATKPGNVEDTTAVKNEGNNGKVVYTSFYPIEFATKYIVGDKIEVRSLMPAGVEVHDWEPSLKDISKLKDSEMIIINGLELEGWLDDAKEVIDQEKIVEVNDGVELIKTDEDDHDHDHEDENIEEEEHDHDHEDETIEGEEHDHGETHNHEHGEYDPHIWLSIKNYQIIAKNILNAVSNIDIDNKDIYEKNYKELVAELEKLDKEYSDSLNQYRGKHIIVPHEAFAYLAKDYGLVQIPIENITSDSEPDLKTIANIVDTARDEGIKTVFYEGEDSAKVPNTIAQEIGGKIMPIHTLEFITDKQSNDGENYLTLMEENYNNILESFKE